MNVMCVIHTLQPYLCNDEWHLRLDAYLIISHDCNATRRFWIRLKLIRLMRRWLPTTQQSEVLGIYTFVIDINWASVQSILSCTEQVGVARSCLDRPCQLDLWINTSSAAVYWTERLVSGGSGAVRNNRHDYRLRRRWWWLAAHAASHLRHRLLCACLPSHPS